MAKWTATSENLPSYGERIISSVKWKAIISEIYDYLHIIRTASCGTVEPTAENGELWYDTNEGQNTLKVKTATGWGGFVKLDQTTPQTITAGALEYDEVTPPVITKAHQLVDKKYVDTLITEVNTDFFMTNTDDTIAGYKTTSITPPAGERVMLVDREVANDELMGSWVSPEGIVPSKFIAGVYSFIITAEKHSGTKSFQLYWKLYERLADNTETEIGRSSDSDVMPQSGNSRVNIALVLEEAKVITAGSRVVGKLFAKLSSGGNFAKVRLYILGDTASRWTIPSSKEILAQTFVSISDTTATPTANKIPIAGSNGKVDEWVSTASSSVAGTIKVGSLLKISSGVLSVDVNALHGVVHSGILGVQDTGARSVDGAVLNQVRVAGGSCTLQLSTRAIYSTRRSIFLILPMGIVMFSAKFR